MDRVYFVIDMKSFFASVECAERNLDPFKTSLVVADSERGGGTICLAISPYMKTLGIRNRCRLYEIPSNVKYIVAPPRMKKYIEYASKIYGIYLKYIDKNDIHVYSIDECFIDVTDYLKLYKLRAKAFAKKLMQEIEDKLHIPSTCGIGSNMYLAKIALDITAKHSIDRIGWLTEEKFIKELWEHKPLSDFWGINDGTIKRLFKYGITDMKGIANAKEDLLYKEFGVNAELLIDHAWGKETCLMCDIKSYKSKSTSFSNSQILPPPGYNMEDGMMIVREMIQQGCFRLVREKKETELIHLFLSYQDGREFSSKGTIRLDAPTSLYSKIIKEVEKLYFEIVDGSKLIRQIGFDFSDLVDEGQSQFNMFTDYEKEQKEKNLTKTILDIHDKFGKNSLVKAMDLKEKATLLERNRQIGGHKSGE